MSTRTVVTAVAGLLLSVPVSAQQTLEGHRFFIEGRGGVVAPTFDIADVATLGPSYGVTLGAQRGNLVLMAAFDHGMHEDEPTEAIDIRTRHYMGKVGISLTGPVEQGLEVLLNLGAGAVTFDVEGLDASTYFAINAGGKILYHFSPAVALVLSPQGDIAFTDEDELDTGDAWVWPLTAGLRLSF